MYADNLGRKERKAFLKENYLIKCFLTKQEISFWRAFVAVQMMRDPVILKEAIGVVKETSKGCFTDNQIRTIAVSQCLPLLEEFEGDAPNVFNFFRKPLLNMSILIGVDESGTLFTSDNPVFCFSSQKEKYIQEEKILSIDEYEQIILPLTSNLVLLMFGKEWKKCMVEIV